MNPMKHYTRVLFVLIFSVASVLSVAGQKADDKDPEKELYRMTRAAPAAFIAGDFDKARAMAEQLLVDAEVWPKNWNYGNAIHTANLVLGRIALRNGEIDDAKKYLIAAGKTPGSPQLNSFGPDMLLARELLKKGEKDVVLEYFDLCEKFWDKQEKLTAWRAALERDEIPEFGPNLRYVFHSVR